MIAPINISKLCMGQILSLTQIIENDFETRKITSIVFIDLIVAYDMVNYRIMIYKLYKITHNFSFVKLIEALLSNISFVRQQKK